jgi:hypothetical protein
MIVNGGGRFDFFPAGVGHERRCARLLKFSACNLPTLTSATHKLEQLEL